MKSRSYKMQWSSGNEQHVASLTRRPCELREIPGPL